MFSILQICFFLIVFMYCPALFNRWCCKIEARVNTADISYIEGTGDALRNATTNNRNADAADESDILMPPIEFTEAISGIADVTIAPSHAKKANREEHSQAPIWWHTYDALLMSLSMMVMLLLMVVTTQCMWRRHIEQRAAEWEAESTRILCSTPYYIDRNQILVY